MRNRFGRAILAGSFVLGATGGAAIGSAAMAHPGSHHGMSLSELALHLSTGWHLVTLLAVAAFGIGILVLVRRHQSRVGRWRRQPGRRS